MTAALKLPLPVAPAESFEITLEHGYDIDTDTLTLDVDCSEFGRAFTVAWCAWEETMALVPDGKGGRGHWTGFGPDGKPDGCVQSREECPVNEAMALLRWLCSSTTVRMVHERWVRKALEIHDPR
jgi:hypothetical protein